ncbi:MAG: hypothetical protein IT305_00865 [Chloroflexi bacterium]|nr:hypothetical protein [Chloroflexota bacterium]
MSPQPMLRATAGLGRRAFLRHLAGLSAIALVPNSTPSLHNSQQTAVQQPGAPCLPRPLQQPVRPIAPARLAADLPAPFAYTPRIHDTRGLLRDVAGVVAAQATDFGAPACYVERPQATVERVDFLSPFEFLVVSLFGQDPERRDGLLDRYADDPHAAIRELGESFPSPKGQLSLTSFAYYDLDADRIRVNSAALPPGEARRVLVHELWHAMPDQRRWSGPNGVLYRGNGFWVQQRGDGHRAWIPVEEHPGLPYPQYLLDEGMAVLMELRFAGPSRYHHPDVLDVQRLLDHLIGLAEPGEVLGLFLTSHVDLLGALIETNRSRLPELPAS